MPDAPLAEQQVVLTVPASFDASARELTREAALAAGLPETLVLLEEPQAAVYAWLADTGERWRRRVAVGDMLLVCDVGGGTTDLTLVGVAEEEGELVLRRIAVGNHLLVGGDNMDLALAHLVAGAFAERGVGLDPWQSVALWHSCRAAKEALLAAGGPDSHPVAVLGRGSRLIGGTVSVEVDAEERGGPAGGRLLPARRPRRAAGPAAGVRLPGARPAVRVRHGRHPAPGRVPRRSTAKAGPARPTHVLFNGGVFKAEALRERAAGGARPLVPGRGRRVALEAAPDLDHAVARGAAYYGWVKQGGGVRIRGGTARAYYVGIETAGLAVPGAPRPLPALCVVPIGMEEGTEADVPSASIGLVVGRAGPVPLLQLPVRKHDQPGDVLRRWAEGELAETDSLEATLPPAASAEQGAVPVRFHSRITELGVFELWCVSQVSADRWKLEFSVREETPAA